MIRESDQERVKAALGLPELLGEELTEEFVRHATLARIPAGRDLMAEGEHVQAIPLLLSGSIRVYKIGESGREITLYRSAEGNAAS